MKKDIETELLVSDLTDILFRGDIYYKALRCHQQQSSADL